MKTNEFVQKPAAAAVSLVFVKGEWNRKRSKERITNEISRLLGQILCKYFLKPKICDTGIIGCPKITPFLKCLAPDAFSGAKLHVFLENG